MQKPAQKVAGVYCNAMGPDVAQKVVDLSERGFFVTTRNPQFFDPQQIRRFDLVAIGPSVKNRAAIKKAFAAKGIVVEEM